jgi:hypothetical protein
MSKKRVIVLSDAHCGHMSGLTPPPWHVNEYDESTTKRNKYAAIQRELWINYINILEKYKPFDVGFSMGDMVDGKGQRSGGTELITSNRDEQVDMACEVHRQVSDRGKKNFNWIGVYGTGYHVSGEGGEDWEDILAERAKFKKIGSHEWVDVNGCIFDLKHHIGGSQIPYGKFTSPAKDRLWNLLWADKEQQPKANVILRGHVHYYSFCGESDWVAMTLPALQGIGTKFGARRMSGVVHWGLTIFDVNSDGTFEWTVPIIKINSQKAEAIKI